MEVLFAQNMAGEKFVQWFKIDRLEADGILAWQRMANWGSRTAHAGPVQNECALGSWIVERRMSLLLSALCYFPVDLVFPNVSDKWQPQG